MCSSDLSTFLAAYTISGELLKKACEPYSASKGEDIGRAIRESKANHKNPVEGVLEVTGGFELFRGKVEIGRASIRERVTSPVYNSVVDG